MRYPSIKTIATRLNLDKETAKKIRAILDGSDSVFWRDLPEFRYFYNPPAKYWVKLSRINDIIECFGIKYIPSSEDDYVHAYGISYCKSGDCYTNTVIFDHNTGRYIIGNIGYFIEKYPRRFSV